MFQKSSQNISFNHKQVINLDNSYACPKCEVGNISQFGHSETFLCNECRHKFVPLKASKLLYPANDPGFKIALTYWYDGQKWHKAGTTASFTYMLTLMIVLTIPPLILNYFLTQNIWLNKPYWCNNEILILLSIILELQLFYTYIWDGSILIDQKTRTISRK